MRRFYETYSGQPKLSPLVRELSWSHNQLALPPAATTLKKARKHGHSSV
jgi:hypothetical protein